MKTGRISASERQGMIATLRSLILEGSEVDDALLQIAFEHGSTPEQIEDELESAIGDIYLYALNLRP